MAVSTTTVSATELTNKANDKPIVCGLNCIRKARTSGSSMKWYLGAGTPTMASTDSYTVSTRPVSFIGDDATHLQTTTVGTSTTCWLLVDFGSTYTVDFVALFNSNFLTAGAALTLELSDTSSFTSTVTALSSVPVAANGRWISTTLGGGTARYTGARYMRARFVSGGAFTPSLGEMWVGQRTQLYHQPDDPWTFRGQQGAVDVFETYGGGRTIYSRYGGRRTFAPTFVEVDTTAISDMRAWYKDCGNGTLPFLWVDKPTSDPQRVVLMHQPNPGMTETAEGPVASRFEFTGCEEIGPPFQLTE